MKNIVLLFTFVFLFASCVDTKNSSEEKENSRELIPEPDANPELTTAQTIAYNNGIAHWKNVNEIQFTFNVDREQGHFERHWIWKPKTDDVTLINKGDTLHFNRKNKDSINLNGDAPFVNDKFWLLTPFQLVWDEGTSFSEKKDQEAPISKEKMDMLTITYGSEGGYTPGDAYDLYYDSEYIIKEWAYRHKNDSVASMVNTWEDYETFNGIKISKMHKNESGDLKIYFTNLSVK